MAAAAAMLLERGDDAIALLAVSPVAGCAPAAAVADVMRSGLTRRTGGDVSLKSPDQSSYDTVDHECNDNTVIWPDGAASPLCLRFPRLAGSWLARRCDEQAVAAAVAAAATASGDYDPRTDMVLDGALRVLGNCDREAFEQAIAKAPDTPPDAAIADARGKQKLRELFLNQ